jgi:serine/threonine-protein kinase
MTELPATLGKYRIERILGRGAMGTVYQGFDPDIERRVAIKVLHPHLLDSEQGPALRERFRREAQAAARCLHPNIVTVFELGQDQGADFIVSELIEGEELKVFLESGTNFSRQEIGLITGGVLKALAAAHAQGIVHRDIKPANILLLDDGNIKVADFGVARLQSSDLTLAGFMVGTPGYMSPEALRGEVVDQRADLYSTGVVLLELLTGKRARLTPLAEQQHRALVDEMLSQSATPIDPALQALVHKALAPEMTQRFATANDFASALFQALGLGSLMDESLSAQLSTTLTDQRTQLPAKSTRQQSWNPELLSQLEKDLRTWLGPMAPHLLKAAASKNTTASGLIDTLASGIKNNEEKALCIAQLHKSLAQSSTTEAAAALQGSGTSLNMADAELARLRTSLARYLGPMAGTIIQRNQRKTTDRNELIALLAEAIPNSQDRHAFLKELGQH